MTLEEGRDAIVSAIEGVGGVQVYDHVPDSVAEFPAALIRLSSANYSLGTYTFGVLVLAAGWNEGEAEKSLHPYLELTGSSSLPAAIDTDPGLVTVSCGGIERRLVGGQAYLGAELVVVASEA